MDKEKKQIEEQVGQTLASFKLDQPPEMDPWFYDRLTRRIQAAENSKEEGKFSWITQSLKPGLVAGLVALNILMMIWTFTPEAQDSQLRSSYIEDLSTEYGLNFSDSYLVNDGEI